MSNLEPIEESDLDLAKKFSTGEKLKSDQEIGASAERGPVLEKEKSSEVRPEKEAAYEKILSKVKQSATAAAPVQDVKADAAGVVDRQGVESKINRLVSLAIEKGVPHAVDVARHLDDNYILDEFHDRLLAEDLHEALMAKGLIRNV